MSRSLNKVLLIGNVGMDPILKKTPGGIPVTSFRMATSQTWKDRSGGLKEQTDWHTIVAWRGLAEIVERLIHRGSRIFVEGRLQTRIVEDKTAMKQKQIVEVLADNILLLDGKVKIPNGKDDKFDLEGYHLDEKNDFHSHDDFFESAELHFENDFNFDFDTDADFNTSRNL
jgi:single-strand DNA-binding protein